MFPKRVVESYFESTKDFITACWWSRSTAQAKRIRLEGSTIGFWHGHEYPVDYSAFLAKAPFDGEAWHGTYWDGGSTLQSFRLHGWRRGKKYGLYCSTGRSFSLGLQGKGTSKFDLYFLMTLADLRDLGCQAFSVGSFTLVLVLPQHLEAVPPRLLRAYRIVDQDCIYYPVSQQEEETDVHFINETRLSTKKYNALLSVGTIECLVPEWQAAVGEKVTLAYGIAEKTCYVQCVLEETEQLSLRRGCDLTGFRRVRVGLRKRLPSEPTTKNPANGMGREEKIREYEGLENAPSTLVQFVERTLGCYLAYRDPNLDRNKAVPEAFLQNSIAIEPLQGICGARGLRTAILDSEKLLKTVSTGSSFERFRFLGMTYARARWHSTEGLLADPVLKRYGKRACKPIDELEKLPIMLQSSPQCVDDEPETKEPLYFNPVFCAMHVQHCFEIAQRNDKRAWVVAKDFSGQNLLDLRISLSCTFELTMKSFCV